MKIKNIISRNRRDFWAIYECEHCGHETEKESGYDDNYFHREVIPSKTCPKCKKKGSDEYVPMKTKYPSDLQL